ncbi:unnamed protein product [Diatraea saccharalis]|uniref:WASH complex subunit 3 n=1 Tax=Diatraea saccharalis TaxID=40085 RepID=A0A9N9QYH6_9NEOP|nr:unnamed protein product [Diatraea saccharalis]
MQGSTAQDIANLDLSTIAALQQKRTLAFVNHFVLTTVQFLNNFAKKCEQKLMSFERKLEKVEAAMVLLETRLSSIPEINRITDAKKTDENKEQEYETANELETNNEEIKEINETTQITLQPEYDRFVKMVQVGVPLQAVKLKVAIEGLDPDVLEQIINK